MEELFELFNNQLVQQLNGPQDSNLKLLEKLLNVEISSFGNKIKINGEAAAVKQARNALEVLHHKLSKGVELNEQEVKAAVRLTEDSAPISESEELADIVLKTKKRHIYPRSATQARYIQEMMNNEMVFGLGPAGTGKTSLISALVKTLEAIKIKTILLAPTGRAAKVVSRYSGHSAYTIHKKIYRQKSLATAEAQFSLDYNREKDAVFIVDEASMLANYSLDASAFGSGNLLDDLVSYVRQGSRCRLIFVGDSAQLPPVGLECSPALDPEKMRAYGDVLYGRTARSTESSRRPSWRRR